MPEEPQFLTDSDRRYLLRLGFSETVAGLETAVFRRLVVRVARTADAPLELPQWGFLQWHIMDYAWWGYVDGDLDYDCDSEIGALASMLRRLVDKGRIAVERVNEIAGRLSREH